MASQFDTARVALQPTQQEAPLQTDIFGQGANVFGQQAGTLAQEAETQTRRGEGLFAKASASFDKALSVYNDYAEKRGAEDAAGIIKRDGNQQLIAPSSFYPPGISSRAYAESYKKTAEALYRSSAETDYQGYSSQMLQQYGNDVGAYRGAMEKFRQGMLTGMDERFKPFMDIRFQQIDGAASSQIAVRIQSDQNTRNKEVADRDYTGIVNDSTKLAGWATGTTPQTEETAKTIVTNSAVMQQRIADWEVKARAAGYSQVQIERNKAELGFNVAMATAHENIRNLDFSDGQGNVDGTKVANIRAGIRQAAQQLFPGRAKQVEEQLNQGLDYAIGQSSRFAQGQQLADQKLAEPRIRDAMRLQEEARQLALNPTAANEMRQAEITAELGRRTAQALNDPSLHDSVAMRLGAAYAQTGAVSRGALQESFNTRLTGLGNVIGSSEPGVTRDHKNAAYAELATIRDDPSLVGQLTAGQRSYIQGQMDNFNRAEASGNFAAVSIRGVQGQISPPEAKALYQGMIEKGQIGIHPGAIMRPAEADIAFKQWNDAYNAKQTESTLAADHKKTVDAGGIPTEDMEKARAARQPFRNVGDKPDFNPQNPDELAKFAAHYSETTQLPPMVKQAVASMPRSNDPKVMDAYGAVYDTVYATEERQLEKRLGPVTPETFQARQRMVQAKVTAVLGESEAAYIATGKRWTWEGAQKKDMAAGNSKTGQAGQSAEALAGELDRGLDSIAGDFTRTAEGSTTLQQVVRGNFSAQARQLTQQQQGVDRILTGTPGAPNQPTTIGQLWHGITGGTSGSLPSTATFTPEARAILKEGASVYLATHGKAIADQVPSGTTQEQFALSVMMAKPEIGGMMEARPSADGKTMVIGLKSFGSTLGQRSQATGPLSAEAEAGSITSLVQEERRRAGLTGTNFDPKSAKASAYLDQNNQPRFFLSVSDRNGIPWGQMDISANDPRISVQALAAQKAVLSTIYTMNPGMSPADAVHAAGRVGRFLGSIEQALFGQGRLDDIMAGRYVDLEGHRAEMPPGGGQGARPDIDNAMGIYSKEFQTRLQGLQRELGPNGPNANAIISEMSRNNEVGAQGTWLQRLLVLGGTQDKPQPARPTGR